MTRYRALATDYDGTIAKDGRVAPATLDALARLRARDVRLLLVTGRELDDLMRLLPQLALFDRIVAENGALLYRPAARSREVIAPPPDDAFVRALARRGVSPLDIGASIVATVAPNETIVARTIRDLALDLRIVFNKGAVMVLPADVDKASGLARALDELGVHARDTVAVGDAENDVAMFALAGYAAAVANALPAVKARARRVLAGSHGAGVVELIDDLLADRLR